MTQYSRETVWVCENHDEDVVVIAPVGKTRACDSCTKNMYEAGWIDTKEEDEA